MHQKNGDLERKLSVALVALAVLYRLVVSIWLWRRNSWFFALSADEVERALLSFEWWRSPQWFPAYWWPPLPFWLTGLLIGAGVPTSLAPSILSLVAGIGALPVYYLCLRRCLSSTSAALGTWFLACQPELIWLSISGLAESQLFFFISCAVAGAIIFWVKGSLVSLLLASLSLCLATATRYEAWIVFPLFLAWLVIGCFRLPGRSLVTRMFFATSAIIISSIFVLAWCRYQWISHGHPLAFVDNAARYLEDYFEPSIRLIGKYPRALLNMSPVIMFLASLGLPRLLGERFQRPRPIKDPVIWVIGIFGLMFTYQLWSSVQGLVPTHNIFRTMIIPMAFLFIPLASEALEPLISRSPRVSIALFILAAVFVTGPRVKYHVRGVSDEDIAAGRAVGRLLPTQGRILVEIKPWNFNTIRLFSGCLERKRWLYDRGTGFSGKMLLNDERNPSIFAKPMEKIGRFLEDNDVEIAIIYSPESQLKMEQLGWTCNPINDYTICVKNDAT